MKFFLQAQYLGGDVGTSFHSYVTLWGTELPLLSRVCAGRYLAEGSMWTAIAKILAVFNISPVKDAEGKLTEPNVKFTSMMTRWVMLFMCESRSI